jgi:serine/threonine protein phosphatase 1
MATYAISDIHGCYDQFQELLDKIGFSDNDTLYVLGDIIDRGPKSAEMLRWALDDASENVHFLLGNHELMMLEEAQEDGTLACRWDDTWEINGGTDTLDQINEMADKEWQRTKIVPWAKSLKPWAEISVDGKPMMLVHAGFDLTGMFDDRSLIPDIWPEGEPDQIPHGFGPQDNMTMTWIRRGWYDCEHELPLPVICGHTPTSLLYELAQAKLHSDPKITKMSVPEWAKTVPYSRIWVYKNRIDIDCGCAYDGQLAALRLDDMAEFYVDGYKRS